MTVLHISIDPKMSGKDYLTSSDIPLQPPSCNLCQKSHTPPPSEDDDVHGGIIPVNIGRVPHHPHHAPPTATPFRPHLLHICQLFNNTSAPGGGGGDTDSLRVCNNNFDSIDQFFHPKAPGESIWYKSNSLKKWIKGDSARMT